MIKLYDKKKAVPFILRRIYLEEYPGLAKAMLESLIEKCVDADFDYMFASDIYRPDGSRGENYYNKANAREHILFKLINKGRLSEQTILSLCKLVDDYLDFNLSYLEANGLRYPTDD